MDFHTALATLDWQIELGADEAIGEEPVNRYDLPKAAPKTPPIKTGPNSNIAPIGEMPAIPMVQETAPDIARIIAGRCETLASLRDAMAVFDLCALKKGARNLVFSDGNPAARIMIIGEAPGRDEDREGKPFVGRAGQLLDKMFAAIDLSRSGAGADSLYITNVMPWRPPQNRDPEPEEIAMMLPFLQRHVELVDPDLIVLMGNTSCKAALGKMGITRLRGTWTEAFGKPAMPMFHPAALLRDSSKKKGSWADLLDIRARLNS